MKKRWVAAGVTLAAAGALFVMNASMFARPSGSLTFLAHRGVHQLFPTAGLKNDDCTATRIYAPTHGFIENTLPSIEEAFKLGAVMVEIDIHPTTDGEFAIFHDWGVDCRTNGQGVTRELSMAYLKTLDIGYGYTADGGATFPFRGKFVGAMPTLAEVLAAFPGKRFLVNFKSNDAYEVTLLHAYLAARPELDASRLAYVGSDKMIARMRELDPDALVAGRGMAKKCALDYMLTGWLGVRAESCRNTIVGVPANYAWVAWGWPNRFLERMRAVDVDVYIFAPLRKGEQPGGGVDDAETFAMVPRDWRGGVMTNAIEQMAPLADSR